MAAIETSLRSRTESTARVRRLRDDALVEAPPNWEVALYGSESWLEASGEYWWIVRRGKRAAHVLRNMDVVIGPDDILVSRLTRREPTPEEEQRTEAGRTALGAQPVCLGQGGHMALDYAALLDRGCLGMIDRIDALDSAPVATGFR